ncbi:phenylalanyl-tRNA synthetase subunit beta [Mycolicibacterium conceptionense]|jgi:phenylalanyl-tRNA synthetase beta chain|uniref:Phenylalanine--tRNA ligase beta subunit n=3 Tax=Mycolicibacterium TaxID=1866885 RepID=A0ABR5FMZ6_9MYCO|nr:MULTISPECIES: phenylalanine--tRNA ligase subunit beta [Mycolicibacterium]KLI07932.1 phenylalanyl-tRNA synthetase subunit beta [Mycolicibacterium senegalense]KLO48206.1 phenylalanyl-tRNA synthetase subunit beta [Mycolicibacterium senegalense]KMV20625.1 phenylalanyl-tRNA synthetase subunit beta [Mycolicibacterium conceptionense]OBJ97055.1 phenylalanine--tRNA ligase subunit beta [Mycolicibacterium conceptionense]OMB86442.1 phenylalanine--tRNA ligase subunit beta [Mycolicibacterium conceptionen
MRIPFSWLREAVRAGAPDWDVSVEELEQTFIRIGHEVEEIIPAGPVSGPLTVGRVAEIEELTEFKKPIRACKVDVGEPEPRDIVCGATNFAVGDLVVVALPGTVLPGDFKIATRKTYGRVSDGMICSASEMNLGVEGAGILVLPEGTAEPGTPAADILGLDDVVFHLAITPDRGYCLSVRGLAREIACAHDLDFADLADVAPLPAEGEAWPLTVEPGTGVQRFGLRPVTGIDPTAVSPWWMQRRLMLSGIRAISPAVDVTNYVMLEIGHPMHAHDSSLITGGFAVRFARDGEKVITLDDVERTLNSADVLIVDDVATAAIGGVMGAGTTEVRDSTTDVLLEAAVWDPAAVSRTQRRLHLASEAGRRYERSVDPAISVAALDRCASLLAEIAGGRVEPKLTDWRADDRTDWSQPTIEIPADLPDRTAGVEYAAGTTARRLAQIGAEVTGSDPLAVTPPSWRPDLRQRADLVEEVLRLEGLESIPSVLPTAPAGRGLSAVQKRRRAIGKSLALAGFVEVLPTPFLPAGVFDAWGLAAEDPRRNATKVLNPLEADRPQLATTLLPGLLEALGRNVSRGTADVALFAIQQVVHPTAETRAVERIPNDRRPTDDEIAGLDASLPRQPQHVAAVLAGLREPAGPWGPGRPVEASDAFEAVRVIGRAAGVEFTLRAAQELPWHPGRCAEVLVGDTVVGYAGQLHPAVIERTGLPKGACAVELDLDAVPIVETLPAPKVSPFPAVFQDISVVVDAEVASAAVVAAVRDGAGDLLEDVRLFDVYTGPQIGEGRKSLTLALRFRAADRTLTEDEASAARDAAVAVAGDRVGAVLRG